MLQTFVAISSGKNIVDQWLFFFLYFDNFFSHLVLVYVGDPRVSAVSQTHRSPTRFKQDGFARPHQSYTPTATVSGRLSEPYFAADASPGEIQNVTAQLGTTTYLHCRVNSLGGKTVSN